MYISIYQEQIEGYHHRHHVFRNKHDVVVVGDSIIKHIDGRHLSCSKNVKCVSFPAATVRDIFIFLPCEFLKPGGELIIHAGTNNISEGAGEVSHQITDLASLLLPRCLPSQSQQSSIVDGRVKQTRSGLMRSTIWSWQPARTGGALSPTMILASSILGVMVFTSTEPVNKCWQAILNASSTVLTNRQHQATAGLSGHLIRIQAVNLERGGIKELTNKKP